MIHEATPKSVHAWAAARGAIHGAVHVVYRVHPCPRRKADPGATPPLSHSLPRSLAPYASHTRARAHAHRLHQSTTGNGADAKVQLNLRRSKSAWLHHGHSKVVDAIYQRLGQVTKVSEWCVGGAWAVRGRVMAIVTSGHVGSARRRALTAQPDSPALR